MYELINNHINPILDSISEKHISDYEWLMKNKHNIGYNFKRRYKSFWQLNAALLSDEFCDEYFSELQNCLEKGSIDLRDITKKFYDIPSNRKGANKLQFSFCTKLCYLVNPCLPIYDAMVRDFFFFKEPNRKLFLNRRIEEFMYFYDFLVGEYDRILKSCLEILYGPFTSGLMLKTLQRKKLLIRLFGHLLVLREVEWSFLEKLFTAKNPLVRDGSCLAGPKLIVICRKGIGMKAKKNDMPLKRYTISFLIGRGGNKIRYSTEVSDSKV